jgi:hypothetical protein
MGRELRSAGDESGPPKPARRRERRRRTRPSGTPLGQVDLLEAIRLTSVPASIGAGAWTHSWGWFLAAVGYNVLGGPVKEFLDKLLGAAGDRLADRIRHGRRPPTRRRSRGRRG